MNEKAEEMLREYISQAEQSDEENEVRAYDNGCCDGECCAYLGCLTCLNM